MAFPKLFQGRRGVKNVSGITRLWGAGIARIINLEVTVFGDPGPFGGELLVSNHLGYLDIITHSSVFPIRFTPKSEIAKWPLLGWFLALSRPIWIDRSSRQASARVKEQIHDTLVDGVPLIVYPEGTSTDGERLLPFKSTPFEAAIYGDFPVRPMITRYVEENGVDGTVCWYGDMTLLPHAWRLLGRPEVKAEIHVLPPVRAEGMDRKRLAKHVHSIMTSEYERICNQREKR